MAGVNKVILVGHLGKDPEIKYSQGGKAVANFSLATTEKWGQEERTEWHQIVCFDRLAEVCGEYLAKGRQVYIEGRIQTQTWKDKDGQQKSQTKIMANTMQMMGGKGDQAAPAKAKRSGTQAQDNYDDIPF